jgi:hypothetical protein
MAFQGLQAVSPTNGSGSLRERCNSVACNRFDLLVRELFSERSLKGWYAAKDLVMAGWDDDDS